MKFLNYFTKIKTSILSNIPPYIKFLFKTYLLGIVFFGLFRVVLALVQAKLFAGVPMDVVLGAFLMGWRFDTVISGYLLCIVFILATIFHFFPLKQALLKKITVYFLATLYIASFALCATDIPFFNVFGARLAYSVLNWVSTPKIMFSMVFSSWTFYPFIILFIALSGLFLWALKKFAKQWAVSSEKYFAIPRWRLKGVGFIILAAVALMIGIRGRTSVKSPIRWGTAFFSPYVFPNQLGLNPVFTFFKSYEYAMKFKDDQRVYMDNDSALTLARVGIDYTPSNSFNSPIARFVQASRTLDKAPNVVIVMMESMSYDYIGRSGNFTPSLTPFLDSLINQSVFFDRMYSCGNHTFNGLWGSQLSLPCIPEEGNPLNNFDNMQSFSGIAATLRNTGYQTLFICPHDAQFDNIGGVMCAAGYEKVISQDDFFDRKQLDLWGLADHQLFDQTEKRLDDMANAGKPFLATFLTVSNHGPYQMPEQMPDGFQFRTTEPKTRGVEYADASIKHFINKCKTKPWFNNTIFVFMADHGLTVKPCPYELSLSYMHIPLIIYAPNIVQPRVVSNMGMQIDMFPSVMDLLGIPYINNTLGINLFAKSRPYIFHSEETNLCVLSDSIYYLIRRDGERSAYNYKTMSTQNIIAAHSGETKQMENYAYSFIQTTLNLIKNKKAGPEIWKK